MVQSGELGDRELKASYWFLTHKKLLRNILVAGLVALDLVFLVPLGWGIYGYAKETSHSSGWAGDIIGSSVDWAKVHQVIKPKNLAVTRVETATGASGTYDVIVWIKNPNPEWFAAAVDVTALLAGQRSSPQNVFVLPNEEKFIAIKGLRVPATADISQETARTSLVVTSWQRLDDQDNYQLPRFDVVDLSAQNLGDQYTQTRVLGHLNNRSLSGFEQVNITVVLWNGAKAVGVAAANLQNILLNEDRAIDIRFTQMFPAVSDITVSASTNNLLPGNVLDQ